MPDGENIRSVNMIAGGFERSAYSIFEDSREKDIVLWQPGTVIEDIQSLPRPRKARQRAESFLSLAGDSDLAVAPEWSYKVEWVCDHDELFADESPLFVLSCRPMEIETMRETVANLREDFRVIGEDVPDEQNKEFVTPTIVPLRADALDNIDKPTVVIQYKTHPMSEGANPNEADNLAMGDRIHHFGPLSGTGIVVWTCSDLLNEDLRDQVATYAQRGNVIVHPQCNPKPFHSEWTDFRSRIFNNRNDVTYVCANWGTVPGAAGDDAQWGYSGVYTKAREWSSLENYNTTYNNRGLQGVSPSNRAEYVWTLVDDGVSRLRVRREGNGSAPAQGLRPEPHILNTRTWNGSAYDEQPEEINECGCEVCDDCDCQTCSDCKQAERQRRLPDLPRDAELIAAATLWRLEIDEVDSLEDRWDVPLAALKNLRANGHEEVGHSFAVHGHRRGNGVARNTRRLLGTFDAATRRYGRSIDPADRCGPLDIPINATDGGENGVDISLSRLDDPTPGTRRKRLAEIAKLWDCQDDRSFKPLVLMVSPDNTGLRRIDGLEDVTNGKFQPEDVTASSSPVELVEVDR
ncbi:hypothetical protein [Natrinema salsiterrestre]|uniref:Uncharacterized protein n=1 Tax=Natrinema salsiterrestre TaxID=2950540 RepID=A0A9Q4L6R9_9EURY|nr:hypothetical protein [Natrinema salsiterrestre]MDF9747958.1 hypothetical protein [Natrinema salsiterrestre]